MHILNKVILSSTRLPRMKQIFGHEAEEILRQQRYTHIYVDVNGYIDAISPLGEVIQHYLLFTKTDVEVKS